MWAKNRIKYASTDTNYNTRDGFVSEKELACIEAHARGGSGIVTTQRAYTDPKGEGQGYVGIKKSANGCITEILSGRLEES